MNKICKIVQKINKIHRIYKIINNTQQVVTAQQKT